MKSPKILGLLTFAIVLAAIPLTVVTLQQNQDTRQRAASNNAGQTVERYGIFETTFTYSTSGLTNPWEQVSIKATFTTPSNKTLNIDGFYYDTNTYKLRFTPSEIGNYNYSGTITGPSGNQPFSGSFTSVASSNKGFIRRVPGTNFKLQFEDGSAFIAAGFNDCWYYDTNRNGIFGGVGDPYYESTYGNYGAKSVDQYFSEYGDGKGMFNLLRFNPDNCAMSILNGLNSIHTSGNTYNVAESKYIDEILSSAHKHGFHIMFTFFHNGNYVYKNTTDPNQLAAQKRYIDYALARYGAYVDVWEWTNETDELDITDAWLTSMSNYMRSKDPYVRLITNSNTRSTDANYLDVQSPHYYGNAMDLFNLNYKLPQIPGEIGTGNEARLCPEPRDDYFRVSLWTSVLGGIGPIWWNGAFNITYLQNCFNMYIGGHGRTYNRIVQETFNGIDANATPANINSGHALIGSNKVVGYIYGYGVDTTTGFIIPPSRTTTVTLSVPFSNGQGSWINPKNGTVISTFSTASSGSQSFTSPTYQGDIAFKIANPSSPTPAPIPPPIVLPNPTPLPPLAPSNTTVNLNNGLVSYWNLDETSGSRADSAGSGNTLDTSGNVSSAPGKFGNAAVFSATKVVGVSSNKSSLTISDTAQKNLEKFTSFTFSAWVKPNAFTHAYSPILMKDGPRISTPNGNVANSSYTWYMNNDGRVGIGISGTGNYTDAAITSASIVSPGNWAHLVVSYDGSVVRLFKDGLEQINGSFPYAFPNQTIFDSTAPFSIGGGNIRGTDIYSNAAIDEVKIYNRALTLEEIRALSGNTNPPTPMPTLQPTSLPPSSTPIPNQLSEDIDRDGCVGILDFNAWFQAVKGASRTGTFPDINQDGSVDIIDFNLWFIAMKNLSPDKLC